MITIYSIKPYFQTLLKPIVTFLARLKITPNQITLSALLLSIGSGLYFTWAGSASFWLMPLIFLVRMALNALDGMMARQLQMQSTVGTYLNELGDMISDLFLFLPFALYFPWLVVLLAFLSLFTEIAGILATTIGQKRRYDGPMGKSDRAFCLSTLGLLISSGLISDLYLMISFVMMALLLFITIFFRVKNGVRGTS